MDSPSPADSAKNLYNAGTAHVSRNAKMYSGLLVVLVVLVIGLSVWLGGIYAGWWAPSDGFTSNFSTGGNNPLWWHGGYTAGDTQFAFSTHENRDGIQGGSCVSAGCSSKCAPGGSAASESMCGSGCSGATYPSGMASGTSEMIQMGPAPGACGANKMGWSYGATAELDAQVMAGNFAASTPGYNATQKTIDSARSGARTLNDQALHCMIASDSYR